MTNEQEIVGLQSLWAAYDVNLQHRSYAVALIGTFLGTESLPKGS